MNLVTNLVEKLGIIIFVVITTTKLSSCKPRTNNLSNQQSTTVNVKWTAASVEEDFKRTPSIKQKFTELRDKYQINLDDALELLSKDGNFKWLFQDLAIMYRSNGLSSEDVYYPHLRIISFHENTIVAFTSNPEGKFYNVAEIIEFGKDNQFHFSLVDFTSNQFFKDTNQQNTCANCHGHNSPRPIFGAYDFWPLFLASQDHSDPSVPSSESIAPEELRSWTKLCRDYRSGSLSKRLKLFSVGVGVHCGDELSNLNEIPNYGAGTGRPRGFTLALSKIQALRIFKKITSQELRRYRPALAGVFAGCDIETWFVEDKTEFQKVLDSTKKSIFEEHSRRAQLHFSANVDNFNKARIVFNKTKGFDRDYRYFYLLPPNDANQLRPMLESVPVLKGRNGSALNPSTDFIEVSYSDLAKNLELKIVATSRLRFVLEKKAGLDISDWSFSRGISDSSYDLNTNGQGAQAIGDVVGYGLLNSELGDTLIYDLEYGSFGASPSRSKNCDALKLKHDSIFLN